MDYTHEDRRRDIARQILGMSLITDLYMHLVLAQPDPMEFLRARENTFKASIDDMALNMDGGAEPDELLKHVCLHEIEEQFEKMAEGVLAFLARTRT